MRTCKNALTMFGNKADLDALKQATGLADNNFSFENVAASPIELIEATKNDILSPRIVEKFGAMNINSWRLKNWGCTKDIFNVNIIDESRLNAENIKTEAAEKEKQIPERFRDKFRSISQGIDAAMSISFETDEYPSGAIHELSVKHPNILIHFGYDSEAEDQSGWVALKGGEQLGHQHYDSCLRTIRIHVEPHSDATGALIQSISDEESN